MKKEFHFENILYIIGAILLLIGVGSGIYQYLQNRTHTQMMDTLRVQVKDVDSSVADTDTDQPYVSPYETIFSENADCVAWLTIPGTKVDYPVMHTPMEEEYYLHRNYYKEDDRNGCLILAAAANIETPSTNILIHGHNMRSGEMFGDLDEYKNENYAKEHQEIILYSKDTERHYEVMSAFYGKVLHEGEDGFRYYRFFQANSKEEFDEYYQNVKKLSLYDTGITAEFGDELITLSTCSNVGKAGRFVIVGKRID